MAVSGAFVALAIICSLSLVFSIVTLPFAVSASNKNVNGVVVANTAVGSPPSCPAGQSRRESAFYARQTAAFAEYQPGVPCHDNNGDEALYPVTHGASFSKALAHDAFGQPTSQSYASMINALGTGVPSDFDNIQLGPGGWLLLTNPQAGLAKSLIAYDTYALYVPPAPALESAAFAADLVEVYWQALARDVNFDQYGAEPVTSAAITDMSTLTAYAGPAPIVGNTIFRGNSSGCTIGPYMSQFFYQNASMGPLKIDQHILPYTPNQDYLTVWSDFLNVQNGYVPPGVQTYGSTPRYVINGRDLAAYVHHDILFQEYFNALMILLNLGVPFKPSVPYQPPQPSARTQMGFATFGGPHVAAGVVEPAVYALRATWLQKWFVHRRLRPEAAAGLVDRTKFGLLSGYAFSPELLNSNALAATYTTFTSYLLPQAYPEGSPAHPSYPAGHATVAGACVTILKFWFNETFPFPNPVRPSSDGLTLLPLTGVNNMTVGGELNKLAYNVALGRDFAGVHYRTDGDSGLRLGQRMAVEFLRQQKPLYNEVLQPWTATGFDGELLVV